MRLAKFSDDYFKTDSAVADFFHREIPHRSPPGQVFLPGSQIAANGLQPGETILFGYKGFVRFVARAASGRQDNTSPNQRDHPYFFTVDPSTIREITPVSFTDLQRQFATAGVSVSLDGRGWTILPDTAASESVVKALP